MSGKEPIARRDWSATLPRGRDAVWVERSAFEDFSYRSLFEHLTAVRRAGPLAPGDMPLICVLRNERARLPVFFDHYKRLGVTRFIMVDNDSDDGSRDILLGEKLADVFFTRVTFLEGQSGLYWANGLAHALCRGRWLLRVDADELLVYDGMDKHGLPDLARWLEGRGRDRLYAPMRDVYGSTNLDSGAQDLGEFLRSDCWFDSDGYRFETWREGWHMTGGARERLFGNGSEKFVNWLSKYPFLRMGEEVTIFSHHYLWPFDTALEPPHGALLHLKLLGDFAARSRRYAQEGQHVGKSRDYRIMNAAMAGAGKISPRHVGSRRYEGPGSLIRSGLLQPIDWSGLAAHARVKEDARRGVETAQTPD